MDGSPLYACNVLYRTYCTMRAGHHTWVHATGTSTTTTSTHSTVPTVGCRLLPVLQGSCHHQSPPLHHNHLHHLHHPRSKFSPAVASLTKKPPLAHAVPCLDSRRVPSATLHDRISRSRRIQRHAPSASLQRHRPRHWPAYG